MYFKGPQHPLIAVLIEKRLHLLDIEGRVLCQPDKFTKQELASLERREITVLSEVPCMRCEASASQSYRQRRLEAINTLPRSTLAELLCRVTHAVFPSADENHEVNGGDLLETLTAALDVLSPGVLLVGRTVREDCGASDGQD